MFFLQQNWRTREWNRFFLEANKQTRGQFRGKMAQILHTYVSKCKNDKVKFEKNTSVKMRNHIFYSKCLYEENCLYPCENICKLILKLHRSHMWCHIP
jgi:hypothetical protein